MPTPEPYETKRLGTRWRVRFRLPDPSIVGGWKNSSLTFATEPEAEAFCRDIENRGKINAWNHIQRERGHSEAMTLDAWAEIHFASLTEPSKDTVDRYRRIYKECWQPELGRIRLDQIERTDVAQALNKVTGADKTVLNKWGVLTHMLKMAALDGKIQASPTKGVRPGRRTDHEHREHRYLSHDEFATIYEATPAHWRPLLMMAVGTGMRWGELVALEVGDIDVARKTVRVVKAEKRDKNAPGQRAVGPTKTRRSRRTVTLPDEVIEAVLPLLKRPKSERLFLAPMGGNVRHRTFYADIWQGTVLKHAKLADPQPRFHDLRHTHVAWLIAQSVPLPVIQARLGHEKITTTIDTYGHLLPELQRAAAEAGSNVFRQTLPKHPDAIEAPDGDDEESTA